MAFTIAEVQEARLMYYTAFAECPGCIVMPKSDWKALACEMVEARHYIPRPARILGMRVFLKSTVPPGTAILCREDGSLPNSPYRMFP